MIKEELDKLKYPTGRFTVPPFISDNNLNAYIETIRSFLKRLQALVHDLGKEEFGLATKKNSLLNSSKKKILLFILITLSLLTRANTPPLGGTIPWYIRGITFQYNAQFNYSGYLNNFELLYERASKSCTRRVLYYGGGITYTNLVNGEEFGIKGLISPLRRYSGRYISRKSVATLFLSGQLSYQNIAREPNEQDLYFRLGIGGSIFVASFNVVCLKINGLIGYDLGNNLNPTNNNWVAQIGVGVCFNHRKWKYIRHRKKSIMNDGRD